MVSVTQRDLPGKSAAAEGGRLFFDWGTSCSIGLSSPTIGHGCSRCWAQPATPRITCAKPDEEKMRMCGTDPFSGQAQRAVVREPPIVSTKGELVKYVYPARLVPNSTDARREVESPRCYFGKKVPEPYFLSPSSGTSSIVT